MMRIVLVAIVCCFGLAFGETESPVVTSRDDHWVTSSGHLSLQGIVAATYCICGLGSCVNSPYQCGIYCCPSQSCSASGGCSCPSNYLTCQSTSATASSAGVCCPSASSRCYVKLGYNICARNCDSSESQCANGA